MCARSAAAPRASPPGPAAAPPQNGSTFILVAEDLGPADVAEHGTQVAGIALSGGATTAHAAIVARSLGIPMAVQAGAVLLSVADGTALVIDGGEGEVILDPSPGRLELAESASRARALARAKERAESALPAVTKDGRRVRVLVNAATPAEVAAGLSAGAEGAGLIRTELAFLDAGGWPSRADHVYMLTPLLSGLDGADRDGAGARLRRRQGPPVPARRAAPRAWSCSWHTPGPFVRSWRRSRRWRTAPQLRVLLPLVRSVEDVRLTRAILGTLGLAVSLGAMIELPEAADAANAIAAECDFLSVGTNDLTHATLGTDRFSHGEAPAHDPRVLRHIASAAQAAQRVGIPLEVCGEAASDPLTVPLLVGLGADELSVGAARVGAVRAWIRELDYADAAQLAQRALDATDPAAVEELARPMAPAAERQR